MSLTNSILRTPSRTLAPCGLVGLALIVSVGLVGCSEETSAAASAPPHIATLIDADGANFSFDGITAHFQAPLRIYDERLENDEMGRGRLIISCQEGGDSSISLYMPPIPYAGLPDIEMAHERDADNPFSATLLVPGYEADMNNLAVVGRVSGGQGGMFTVDLSAVPLDIGRALYHQSVFVTIYARENSSPQEIATFSVSQSERSKEFERNLGLLIRTCDAFQ